MAHHLAVSQQSDDEALDHFLAAERLENQAAPTSSGALRRPLKVLGLTAVSAVLGVAWWSSTAGSDAREPKATLPPLPGLQLEEKSEELSAAVVPEEAIKRNEKRKRMAIEQDLKTVLEIHAMRPGRTAHFEAPIGNDTPESCKLRAQRLFDEVMQESAMDAELQNEEFHAFKERFVAAMLARCKDTISERLWVRTAGQEMQQQKPVMTAAVVDAINAADMGFKVKMHDWLVHESAATKQRHLGLLPEDGKEDEIKHVQNESGRTAGMLPLVFRAESKWPQCKEEILRIHNQGHCGSCWAFGGLASIDARMCIASNGRWNSAGHTLSRLHALSCSNPMSFIHDSCEGGFPHWTMDMMASTGIASSQCLPYYIQGEGTEHFQKKDAAPPCETHCQGGYSLPIQADVFTSRSIAQYNRYRKVGWFTYKQDIMKQAIYTQGPVAFTFHVSDPFMSYSAGVWSLCEWYNLGNHAVYAFGWGMIASRTGGAAVEYMEASNSWGTIWGQQGHFRIHPSCVVEVTIPGPIGRNVVNHQVGTVDSSVKRDSSNPNWPWPPGPECPYSADGCVTDGGGPHMNYASSEACSSMRLNGRRVFVKEFDTEKGYDFVTINGKQYSGGFKTGFWPPGFEGTFDGIVVDQNGIQFSSGHGHNRAGFRICAER